VDYPPLLTLGEEREVRINARSGRITVRAESREDILVERGHERLEVSRDANGALTLNSGRGGSDTIELRCPTGTPLTIGSASGRVELIGAFGAVRATTASGGITVDRVAAADLRSASGRILLRHADGFCRVQTHSSRAEIGSCGRLDASTHSGRIEVGVAHGKVQVRAASGGVALGAEGREDVSIETMSGSVSVRLPYGVRPRTRLKSLSGRPRMECAPGEDCQIAVRSLSGNIEVVPDEAVMAGAPG
jgi:DUF4097 and DUF4098 domain-containing protein YvlB